MPRRRIMGLALIALAVPFPALALDGEEAADAGPASLSVSASLDRCGIVEAQVICKIDAGWNGVDGAEHYSLSVTSVDGSVVDYGQTTGQSSSVWVPYAGPGTYSVLVSAWGTPPGEEEPELIARDEAPSGGVDSSPRTAPAQAESPGESRGATTGTTETATDAGDKPLPGDDRGETPVCEERTPDDSADPEPPVESDGEGEGKAAEAAGIGDVPAGTAAALEAEAKLPGAIDCP